MDLNVFLLLIILIGLTNGLIVGGFLLIKKTNLFSAKLIGLSMVLFSLDSLRIFLFVYGLQVGFRTKIEDYFHFTLFIPVLMTLAFLKKINNTNRINYLLFLPALTEIFIVLLFHLGVISNRSYLNAYLPIVIDLICFVWIITLVQILIKHNKRKFLLFYTICAYAVIFFILSIFRLYQIYTFYFLTEQSFFSRYWYLIKLICTGVSSYVLSFTLLYFIGYKGKFKSKAHRPKRTPRVNTDLIERIMQENLYLQSDLTIEKLASRYQLSSRELSRVINSSSGKNFNLFINELRLDHFTKRLNKSLLDSYTIYSLAEEAGFNSKATFNRAFKKRFKTTPKNI